MTSQCSLMLLSWVMAVRLLLCRGLAAAVSGG